MNLTGKHLVADPASAPPVSRLEGWPVGLFLGIVVLLVFQPAWHGQPIWDDAAHMTNPELRSWHGLARIWTELGATQQYYPVAHSVFWLEYKLWGDATLGYHLVNILLHVTGALLLLKILRTLKIPCAALAAAIFALHPVQVESVAWITELKNTLSGVCYFGAALAWLRFDRTRGRGAYAAALVIFMTGLMTKSVIATLPAALLLVLWWQRGKITWKRDVVPLIPFFVIGMIAGLFTAWVERQFVRAGGPELTFNLVERCLIAGRAIWFYLGKLIWPVDMIFSYPRWHINQGAWWQYLFPAGALLLVVAAWALRKWRRGPAAAVLYFVGTLFPALGFFNVFSFRYSFVADHFQYLAAAGPIVLACAGMDCILRRVAKRWVLWEAVISALVLAILCQLSWRQCRMYGDVESLWRATIRVNPESWLAQLDLGALLCEQGKVEEAITCLNNSLRLHANNAEAEVNLGAAYDKKGLLDDAIVHYQNALKLRPGLAEANFGLGCTLLKKGHADEAILRLEDAVAMRKDYLKARNFLAAALLQTGQIEAGIAQYREILRFQPGNEQVHYNLGNALVQKGLLNEAIAQFQEATAIRPQYAEARNNLGNVLLRQGRVDEAIVELQRALQIRPDYGQAHFNLGHAFLLQGRADEAILHYQKALAIEPDIPEARDFLADAAWRMATSPNAAMRNGAKAVELAQQTDRLTGGTNAMMAAILAAAYAETQQFDKAIVAGKRALQLAAQQHNPAMSAAIQAQLQGYEAGAPFREKAGAR